MNSVGLIEVKNISRGIRAADAMLKSANVELLQSGAVCPGKFVALIGGELAAIQAAVEHGAMAAEEDLLDQFVIGRLSEGVFPALAGIADVKEKRALGLVETFTAASAILAADAAVKSANVQLIEVRIARGMGGKSFVSMTGNVADVQAAVDAGARIAAESGVLIHQEVIAAPHPDLWEAIL